MSENVVTLPVVRVERSDGAGQKDAWQPIETATEEWIIGYTSWGQQVGTFHEHVGPCERYKDQYQFANVDFDVFPNATHWMPWPAPRSRSP